jgi:hypothetical protein
LSHGEQLNFKQSFLIRLNFSGSHSSSWSRNRKNPVSDEFLFIENRVPS